MNKCCSSNILGAVVACSCLVAAQLDGAVTNFSLINADTDSVIAVLQDAGTISLSSMPSRNLSIRANTDESHGSVVFQLDGETYHTEDNYPFALAGHSNGNYFAWTPGPGPHVLTATPYSGTNGTGAAGSGLTVSFTVEDDYSHRLGSIVVNAESGVPVTIEQTRHDFIFGCMLNIDGFDGSMSAGDEAAYRATFLSNFNYSVHGNAMKWYHTEPDWWKPSHPNDPPRWNDADLVLSWCESNGIPMRGHTLFWGADHATSNGVAWTPDWVEGLSDAELESEVRIRATNTTTRFAGRIDEFDLNNEMTHGNFFKDRLGWGIVSNMAAWAKEGNPNCKLYPNDFSVLNGDAAAYVSHIETLISEGVAIDGIGCQGHFWSMFTEQEVKNRLDTLSTLGLPILVTEYDFNTTNENSKRDGLENLFRACFSHTNVSGIIQWGFWETIHWFPDAALWNSDWSPTPAANKYRELVFGEWWTSAEGEVPSGGKYPLRAFLGTYTVTIDGVVQSVVLTPEQAEVTLTYSGGVVTTNQPVRVSAGSDKALVYPSLLTSVTGVIVEQGEGAPTSSWAQVSGPGAVLFGDASATNTTVTLPAYPGTYVLRFYADDGVSDDHDEMSITLESSAVNLIGNPGFETGTTAGWTQHAGLSLDVVSSESQEGGYSCLNYDRNATYDGVARELGSVLVSGASYVISAWVKLENAASDTVQLTVKQVDGGGTTYSNLATVSASNTEWRRVSGEFAFSSTGTLSSLLLYVSGPAVGVSYWVDAFSCYEGSLATLDLDMDAIADSWEWVHFGGTGFTSGQTSDDADGDGFIDLYEYYALTDPNDAGDVFEVDYTNSVSGQHAISWFGRSSRLYSILSATNLLGPWLTNGYQVAGQDAAIIYTISTTLQREFYRVKVGLDAGTGPSAARDQFGGWTGLKFTATGFFYVTNSAARWWFVTPEGNAFLSLGVNHYHKGWYGHSYNRTHWEGEWGGSFGSPAWNSGFRQQVSNDFDYIKLNTLGMHTDTSLYGMKPYIATYAPADLSFDHDPAPADFVDIFAPEFAVTCSNAAQSVARPNDPMLLGYAMTDMPFTTDGEVEWWEAWGVNPSTTWPRRLRNLGASAPGKQAYVQEMQTRYASIGGFNGTYGTSFSSWGDLASAQDWRLATDMGNSAEIEDNTAFLRKCLAKYYSVAKAELMKADPNHLFFGDKFNVNSYQTWPTLEVSKYIAAVEPYVDVVFIQHFNTSANQLTALDQISAEVNLPVFNGDSSIQGPVSAEQPNPVGIGIPVTSRIEQAQLEREILEDCFARPDFIGFNRCGIIDRWVDVVPAQHQGFYDPFGVHYSLLVDLYNDIDSRLYEIASP